MFGENEELWRGQLGAVCWKKRFRSFDSLRAGEMGQFARLVREERGSRCSCRGIGAVE